MKNTFATKFASLVLAALHGAALSGASFERLLEEPVLSTRIERRLPRLGDGNP